MTGPEFPTDGYSDVELELWSRIGHLAGPAVPSRDFNGCVIGAPDLQSGMTLRKVERSARNGRRAA